MNENFDFGNIPTEDFKNENFDSENEMDDNDDSENDDNEVQEEGFTLDSFTQMVSDEINKLNAEREEAGEEEAMIDQLTEEQLAVVFGLVSSMISEELNENKFVDFIKNPVGSIKKGISSAKDAIIGNTPEELAEKEKNLRAKIDEILTKFKDKNITLKHKDKDETIPFTKESAIKMAQKNKFLGTFTLANAKNLGDTAKFVYFPVSLVSGGAGDLTSAK